MKPISLKYAVIEPLPTGCRSRFDDGSTLDSIPHPGDPHYHVIAHRLGYGVGNTDAILMTYTREHDFCHHFVNEYLFDRRSPALWGVARACEVSPAEAAVEEMVVQGFQRWLRAREQPIIGGIDWHAMRRAAAVLLSAAGWFEYQPPSGGQPEG